MVFFDRRFRAFTIALGGAVVLLPVLGEELGWLPHTYRFSTEGMLSAPQAVFTQPTMTLVMLTVASVATVTVAGLTVGFVRDRFDRVEEHRAAVAWNVRQLVPPDLIPPPKSGDSLPG